MENDFRAWKEELLAKTDLAKVISRYVPLKRKGRTLWGCCPFHHETEPSFAVNEDKQFYHCFGCKESGNAITFIEKIESVDFIDAVKMLAAEAKMELPAFDKSKSADGGISREKRERLYALMRDAAKHYHDNLYGERGKLARDYLEARQVPQRLVTRFGFGASYDGEDIINFLLGKGYTRAEMKEAGLIEQKADRWYDVFYGRLMIPIINNFGEVVAFGGRLIDPGTHIPVKYRNSSNTPIFDKSRTLYAINLLKKKKQREPVNNVIITEGYMDVLALHKAGFDTAVASMGTALTYAQAKLIRNYSTNVYISYDGDSAGQTATLRGLDILREAGLNVRVVSLPDGLDPDDLIKQRGAEAYAQLLKEAQPLPAFKLNYLKNRFDLTTPDGKAAYAIEAMKVVKALENPVEIEEYMKIVHDATGYSMETLRKQADISAPEEKRASAFAPEEQPKPQTERRDKAELFVVASAAHGMPYVDYDEDVYPYLKSDVDREIYSRSAEKFRSGALPSVSALYSEYAPESVDEIVEYEFMQGDDEAKYRACVNRLKIEHLQGEIERLNDEYKATKDARLVPELGKMNAQLRGLKNGGSNE